MRSYRSLIALKAAGDALSSRTYVLPRVFPLACEAVAFDLFHMLLDLACRLLSQYFREKESFGHAELHGACLSCSESNRVDELLHPGFFHGLSRAIVTRIRSDCCPNVGHAARLLLFHLDLPLFDLLLLFVQDRD